MNQKEDGRGCLLIIGFIAVPLGIWLEAGLGWGLIAGGVLALGALGLAWVAESP